MQPVGRPLGRKDGERDPDAPPRGRPRKNPVETTVDDVEIGDEELTREMVDALDMMEQAHNQGV